MANVLLVVANAIKDGRVLIAVSELHYHPNLHLHHQLNQNFIYQLTTLLSVHLVLVAQIIAAARVSVVVVYACVIRIGMVLYATEKCVLMDAVVEVDAIMVRVNVYQDLWVSFVKFVPVQTTATAKVLAKNVLAAFVVAVA